MTQSTATLAPVAPTERGTFARRALGHAVLLGILADALLRNPPWGVGLVVWMIVFAGTVVSLAWRRDAALTTQQACWLGFAVFFSAGFAWRDSSSLQAYDFLGMIGALVLLVSTLSSASPLPSVVGARLRDVFHATVRAVATVAGGILPLVFRDAQLGTSARKARGDRGMAVVRAILITLPLLAIFGALLGEADPIFGSLFAFPNLRLDELISHVVIAGIFTWITGGWMRGAFIDNRSRPASLEGFPMSLGKLEITTVLGALNLLFALFVGVQITWLFGGEALVRSTTGLGYAQYARRGFFELVWVSVLVMPVVLGTRAAIPAGDTAVLDRHRRLTLPLLLLLGAMMLSALGRMRLYVHYYGLTTDRLFASVFMLWLAVVFIWLTVTVLRGQGGLFAAGMTVSGFATLAALNVINPDVIVARTNLARLQSSTDTTLTVDLEYLANQSGDAIPLLVRTLLAHPANAAGSTARANEVKMRCSAVRSVLTRWGSYAESRRAPERVRDWRSWNYGAWRAHTTVEQHERQLREVTCWDNNGESRFGLRELRTPRLGEQWYDETRRAAATDTMVLGAPPR